MRAERQRAHQAHCVLLATTKRTFLSPIVDSKIGFADSMMRQ